MKRFRKLPDEMDQEFSDPNSSPQEERGVSGEAVSFSKAIASTPSEQLSFERYSAARTSTELERRKSEDVTVSGRHPSTGLASLTIDPTRIDSHLVALYDADPSAAQQYRKLAVRLISLVATRPSKRVLITSAKHGEGRTSVALNLAG